MCQLFHGSAVICFKLRFYWLYCIQLATELSYYVLSTPEGDLMHSWTIHPLFSLPKLAENLDFASN